MAGVAVLAIRGESTPTQVTCDHLTTLEVVVKTTNSWLGSWLLLTMRAYACAVYNWAWYWQHAHFAFGVVCSSRATRAHLFLPTRTRHAHRTPLPALRRPARSRSILTSRAGPSAVIHRCGRSRSARGIIDSDARAVGALSHEWWWWWRRGGQVAREGGCARADPAQCRCCRPSETA